MKKIISLLFYSLVIGSLLSGCSFLRTHKMDVEQGNVFSQKDVARLRPGMSQAAVKDILGNPVMMNILSPNRLEYVYTMQPGYGDKIEKRVVCVFQRGRLLQVFRP